MLDFMPVYKRELKTYFQSPSTYVVLALYFLIFGFIFHQIMMAFGERSMMAMSGGMFGQTMEAPNLTEFVVRQVFQLGISLIMFTIPLLTMRLIAEEKSRGTFELMVSCPIGDWSILLGKYFALLTVGLFITLLSLTYPVLAWWAGRPDVSPEWPVVTTCTLGMFLLFGAYGAFGLMASAFTDNQMTAGVVTLIGLIMWQIVGSFEVSAIPYAKDVLQELSASNHTENFVNGVLSMKDLVYFALVSFLFLFIASKTLDARRWRI